MRRSEHSVSKKIYFAFLPLFCATLAACQATAEAPVSEWSVEPSSGSKAMRRSESDAPRSSGVSLNRADGAGAFVVPGTGRLVGAKAQRRGDEGEGEADVTLNFVNLPMAQAVKIVLGDILGVDYVIDPRLDGKVSVHTAHPVRKAVALELFQSALRVAGASLVRSGSLYKVVPTDQAATSGVSVAVGETSSRSTEVGDGAKIVQLRYVSASEMKRVLEPIAQHGGIVRADDARNTLSLLGSPADLAALEDVIGMFDIDTMRGMSFALVPVKSADADTLAEDLRNVFGSEKEGPMTGMIRFIGNKRLAAILVVSPQQRYLERARAWIERLDARAQGTEKQFFAYRVQNRPAKELVVVLASMFGVGGQGAGNAAPRFGQSSLSGGGFGQGAGSSTSPLGSLSATGGSGGLGGGLGGGGLGGGALGSSGGAAGGGLGGGGGLNSGGLGSGGLGGAGAGGFGGLGGGFGGGQNGSLSGGANGTNGPGGSQGAQAVALGEDGRFKVGVDEAKNAIVVMATPDDYKRLLQVIEKLDVLPNQVFIEATIAEVTLTDELQFGVSWFLQKNAHAGAFSAAPTGAATIPGSTTTSAATATTTAAGATVSGATTTANLAALGANILGANVMPNFPGFAYALRAGPSALFTLSALNQITHVNVLSTPSLTVLDNRTASLEVGQQIPITTLSSVSALGNTNNSTQYTQTGVILAITPHISESGRLMLELEQEVSTADPLPANAPAGSNPTIQQRRIKTQVVVADGEALVLGGLIQDSRTKDLNQVPIVGDVPIIGNAFKNRDDTIAKTELLILITPHVVRSVAEAREIANEYKKKLLAISTKAIARPHTIEQTARRTFLDETSVSEYPLDNKSR
jgi:general secretion pathway protein D